MLGLYVDYADTQLLVAGYEWFYTVTGLADSDRQLSSETLELPMKVLAAYVDGSECR